MSELPNWPALWAMEPNLRPDGLDWTGTRYAMEFDLHEHAVGGADVRIVADRCAMAAVRFLQQQRAMARKEETDHRHHYRWHDAIPASPHQQRWDAVYAATISLCEPMDDHALYFACEAVLNARQPNPGASGKASE